MSTEDAAAPVWEASKENIGPVKSGRSTKKLGESVLSAGGLTESQLKRKQMFEEQLKVEEDGYKNRLDTFVEYFKWTREVYPSNSAKSLEILEHIEEAKNNPKFVKMWIEYADLVKAPGELFTYMNSNKIGERVALFWLAWAWVAENAENFKLADQIYQKGLRRQAEPKDQLSKRYQQFQRRLARHYINQSESGASEPEKTSSDPTRKALSKLGESQAASSISRATNENTARRSGISATPVSGSNSSSSTSRSSKPVKSTTSIPAPANNQLGFEIFSDGGAASNPEDILSENPHWKNLASDKERRKENEGRTTAWSEAPLSRAGVSGASGVAPPAVTPFATAPSAGPALSIFVDEEFSKPVEPEPDRLAAGSTGAGLSVRKHLETDNGGKAFVKDAIEKIAKNPLSRHLKVAAPTAEGSEDAPSASSGVSAPSKALSDVSNGSPASESQSVKSSKNKKTEKTVSDENKSSVASRVTATPITAPMGPSSSGFTIFSDADLPPPAPAAIVAKPKSASTLSKPEPSSGGGAGFTIFSDAPVKSAQSSKTKPIQAAPPMGGFSIFSDAPSALTSSIPVVSSSAGAPFTIFSDSQPVTKNVVAKPSSTPAASLSTGFTIFADAPEVPPAKIKSKPTVAAPVTSAPSFTIFSDDTASSAPPNKAKSDTAPSFAIYSDNQPEPAVPAKTVPTAPSFSIFSDPAPVQSAPAPLTAPFTIYSNIESPAPAVGKTKEQHENEELESILATMIDLDNEDATINTRLARHEIDAMFFSPEQPSKKTTAKMGKTTDEPKVFQLAKLQPFGYKADHTNFSAIKDISVIKESSQEYSMCGSISTPFVGNQRAGVRSSFSAGMVFDEDSKGSHSMYISHSSSSSHQQDDGYDEGDGATAQIQEQLMRKLNNSSIAADGASNKRRALGVLSTSSVVENEEVELSLPSRRKVFATLTVLTIQDMPFAIPATTSPSTSALPIYFEIDSVFFEKQKLGYIPRALDRLIHPLHSTRSNIAVFDHSTESKPKCFVYRAKPLPHVHQLSSDVSATPVSMVGRGVFGYAIVMQITYKSNQKEDRKVYKVDADKSYVIWEAFIHTVIQCRLCDKAEYLGRIAESIIIPDQLWLYNDCSVLRMEYATLGTLVDVLKVFTTDCGRLLSAGEHEYLTCLLTIQMIDAIEALHQADILHCDIKTDNWVMKDTTLERNHFAFRICLIDFGKAKPAVVTGSNTRQDSTLDFDCLLDGESDKPLVKQAAVFRSVKKLGSSQQSYTWRYSIDYEGLCECIHNLLFLVELSTEICTVSEATRRGYVCSTESSHLRIPKAPLKRYWNKHAWGTLFPRLLNSINVTDQVDLSAASQLINQAITEFGDLKQQIAIQKLVIKLKERVHH